MYQQFIANLHVNDVIAIAKTYFNIEFTPEELTPILPYVQAHYQEFLNPTTRESFIQNIKEMSKPATFDKLLRLLELVNTKFGKN